MDARGSCKACAKAACAAWRIANKERIKKYHEDWTQKNKESIRIRRAIYRETNRAEIAEKRIKYEKENKGSSQARKQRRRIRKLGLDGRLSKDLVDKLLVLQKKKCPCCKKPLGSDFHLDHIIPLALGGQHADSNMQLLRSGCNLRKHATDPIDYMQSNGFLL